MPRDIEAPTPSPGVDPEALKSLARARDELRAMMEDDFMMYEVPLEVQAVMTIAVDAMTSVVEPEIPSNFISEEVCARPTRQQGQFLAYIREFCLLNPAGLAPSHADFQRFFQRSPPSVNSMLIRLEACGFIRRIPGKARAIKLTIDPGLIPPLERPFRF